MADPFDPTNSDQPASSFPTAAAAMQSPDFFANLAAFGAATNVAANARTPQGFLQYGPDGAGPVGAGYLAAQDQAQQQALARSQLATAGVGRQATQAQIAQTQANTDLLRASLPIAHAKAGMIGDIFGGGGGDTSGTGGTANAPPSGATQPAGAGAPVDFAKTISTMESSNPNALNSAGYAGKYQIGTAALADAGYYKPAPGEDVSKNQWQGQITIPPFKPMSVQDFLSNPNAQDVAFQGHLQTVQKKLAANGATQYIGQTVGGVPINQVTLAAGAHYGGASGVLKFLQSGGKYNPSDAHNGGSGIPLSGYMQAAYQQMAGGSGGSGGAGGGTQPQGGGTQQQGDGLMTPPGLPSPQAALAQADATARQGMQMNMLFPGSGDGLLTRASQLREYALKSVGPFDLRAGGVHWDPVHGMIRNDDRVTMQNPDGSTIYAGASPGVSQNGRIIYPGSVEPLGGQGNATGGGSAPPGAPTGPVAKIGPQTEEILQHQGASYNKARDTINEQADLAQRSNFALDNLRAMSKQVTFDDFAKVRQAILEPLQAAGNVFGIKSDYIDHNLGAYQDAGKISGEIWSTAARQLMGGSREATQTLKMVQNIQPNQTMSEGGLNRVADQMQSLNDLALARQKYAAQYKGPPQDLETNMRQDLDPMAFYVHRMMLTPEGQSIFNNEIVGQLSKTREGQASLDYIRRKVDYANRNGYFNDSSADATPATPTGGAPTQAASANVPQVAAVP